MSISTFISVSLFLFTYLSSFVAGQGQGTTKCFDSGLDWYTGKVGETPCKTYERLRQICNNSFRVGAMNPKTPPDFCNEQVADCCCNNIAFSLSMLCLTCQTGVGSSGIGHDAGIGAYQAYLKGDRKDGSCHPQTNRSLPVDIQSAVCNQKINIYDDLYTITWDDGPWFYIFTSQTITKDQTAQPDKMFTKCPKTSASISQSSSTATTSTSSNSKSSSSGASAAVDTLSESKDSLSSGAIAGIVIGIAVAVIAGALAVFFWIRRKKQIKRKSKFISAGGLNIDALGPRPPAPQPYAYMQANTSELNTRIISYIPTLQIATTSYFPDSSSSHPTHNFSDGTQTTSHPSSNPTGYAPSIHPQSISSGGSHPGNNLNMNTSTARFIVSNPDSTSGSSYSQSLTAASSTPQPNEKASTNLKNTRYIPSQKETNERHVDAGPVSGAELRRNASGRLPPAYGDLIQDG